MKGTDFSFLRLLPSFTEAKNDVAIDSEYFYNSAIILHPSETYLQISNSSIDIAFDDSYKAELINCSEEVLLDITNKVFINEFQDIDGVYQIAFEIIPIEQDFYYKDVYLKLTHLDSDLVLYSNAFNLTADNQKETFRLDYRCYSYNNGVSYDRAQFYQSIRILGYYNGVTGSEESTIYKQLNGKVRKSRVVQSFENLYKLDNINSFTYTRLFNALNNDLVYLNGTRATITDDLTPSDRQGKANTFEADFKAQLNEGESYIDTFQIAPAFAYTSILPLGPYIPAEAPTEGEAVFNYDLASVTGVKLYNYDTDAFIADLSGSITGNAWTFDLPVLGNGKYYILGVFNSVYAQTVTFDNKEVWQFRISEADFLGTDFNNSDFFTD